MKKVAIIGTGISGLGIAHLLHPTHDITLYEKNDYIGGHSRTVTTDNIPVDTGFIVFNAPNYPNLVGLFKQLNVKTQESSMSFGVSIKNNWLEYGTETGLSGMLAQKINILRPGYWKMLWDILKFNRNALAYLDDTRDLTLGQVCDELNIGSWCREYYLLAMGGCIWSTPLKQMLEYPAKTFIRFFKNHGLLTVNDHPQWHTVTGGSKSYVAKITAPFKDKIKLNCGVASVTRENGKVQILDTDNHKIEYDQIIFACHSDQALRMLAEPTTDEQQILGDIRYQNNTAVLHSDLSLMPENKKAWSSWVYLSKQKEHGDEQVSLSYWMNNLQSLKSDAPLIVTLNPGERPNEALIHDEYVFEHPVFDQKAINAQEKLPDIQGVNNTYFCGAWQRYGFHEDGLWSAVRVAKKLGVDIPWA